MLTLAHTGRAVAPHDVWGAWNLDPLLLLAFVLAATAYRRGRARGGRRPVDDRRAWCFAGALCALGIALLSPLEPLSAALASAHMVQHVLLVTVAAPLLALSAPASALLRGAPLALRRTAGRWRRRFRMSIRQLRALHHPVTVWVLHVATLWLWHAAVLYDAALGSAPLHVLEHVMFLVTAVLFWRVVVGARRAGRVSPGLGVLLVFAMGMQSVFLALLLTFARDSWYTGYAATTAAWGLTPLADQQLAGVVMWVPAGFVYVAAGLALLVTWIGATEGDDLPGQLSPPRPSSDPTTPTTSAPG